MTLAKLFKDKITKRRNKTIEISKCLLNVTLPPDELLAFAEDIKDAAKVTCHIS